MCPKPSLGSHTQQAPTKCLQTNDKNSRTFEWLAGWVKGQTPAEPGEGQPATLGACPQDEDKPEDEMAQKRASLLERQQRRAEEARRRKQWQEAEKEQRREEASR